jgi:hypothetical protein
MAINQQGDDSHILKEATWFRSIASMREPDFSELVTYSQCDTTRRCEGSVTKIKMLWHCGCRESKHHICVGVSKGVVASAFRQDHNAVGASRKGTINVLLISSSKFGR